MAHKKLELSPLEKRYNLIAPKFPLSVFKIFLKLGVQIGAYPKFLWKEKKPNTQNFMRTLHPTCEICGCDKTAFSLDVHHLVWDAKHDCTYENLFVLCRSDHSRLHRREWYPSKPWLKEWGDVPQGLIDRGHLDPLGNAIIKEIPACKNDNSNKSKKTPRKRKDSKLQASL
jgi:hypothetical protein